MKFLTINIIYWNQRKFNSNLTFSCLMLFIHYTFSFSSHFYSEYFLFITFLYLDVLRSLCYNDLMFYMTWRFYALTFYDLDIFWSWRFRELDVFNLDVLQTWRFYALTFLCLDVLKLYVLRLDVFCLDVLKVDVLSVLGKNSTD